MDVADTTHRKLLEQLATLGVDPEEVTLAPTRSLPKGDARTEAMDALAAGESEERLVIHDTLGEGGMGIVRLGTQVALAREVAVKSLRPDARTRTSKERLLREARITGQLEHPNVVPVHDIVDCGDDDAQVLLKRIQGVAWSELISNAAGVERRFGAHDLLSWNLSIFDDICNAVGFAHSRGVVHRDIKPDNVMVGEFGEVYLLDWGIAVRMKGERDTGEIAGIAGTPAYMAPEMLQPDTHPISPTMDIYLLGATLCEIATGEPPHGGESFGQILASIEKSEPALPEHVPEELASIIRRAMRPDPTERFSSVADLQSHLHAFVEHRESNAIGQQAAERVGVLRELLQTGGDDDRTRIEQLFSEARFGFHQALRSWPENRDAHEGLVSLVEAMARHELENGDPAAAERLLHELATPPPALVAEIGAALDEEARMSAEVVRRSKLLDPSVGGRQRTVFFIAVGSFFALVPLAGYGVDFDALGGLGHGIIVAILSAALIGIGAFWRYARETVFSTLINRHTVLGVTLMTIPQLPAHVGDWISGTPVTVTMHNSFPLFAGVVGLTSVVTTRWFALPSAGYMVGYVVVAYFPATVWASLAVCNLLVVAGLFAWLASREPE